MTSNVLIDYLKFEIAKDFESSSSFDLINTLFSLLKIKIESYVTCSGKDGMLQGRLYDEHLYLGFDPSFSISTSIFGEDFFIIELSGQACREFELRGGDWQPLIAYLHGLKKECKILRIDLAKDDLLGVIPFDDLKHRLRNQFFISSFRSSGKQVDGKKICDLWETPEGYNSISSSIIFDVDYSDFVGSYREQTRTGFTADFGNKSSFELEIYDKKAERIVNGAPSGFAQWLRFELRFGAKKGDNLLPMLSQALIDYNLDGFISCLLYGALDFRDVPADRFIDRHHYAAYPSCSWWVKFLGELGPADKIKVSSLKTYTSTFERTINWVKKSVARPLMRLSSIDDGETLKSVILKGYADKLLHGKFDSTCFSARGNYLRAIGIDPDTKSHAQLIAELYDKCSDYLFDDYGELLPLEDVIALNVDLPRWPHKKVEIDNFKIYDRDFTFVEETNELYLSEHDFSAVIDDGVQELELSGDLALNPEESLLLIEAVDGVETGRLARVKILSVVRDSNSCILTFEVLNCV